MSWMDLPTVENFISYMEIFCHENISFPEAAELGDEFMHSTPPKISFRDYVYRICEFVQTLEPLYLTAVALYAQRLLRKNIKLNLLSIHRFTIAALCLASKAHGDAYYSNLYYSKVGGIDLLEMNRLELKLATLLEWNLQCKSTDFINVNKEMISLS